MRKALLLAFLLYLPFAYAKDYGVYGNTFAIAEMDFLDYIQQKIKTMQANGEWRAVQADFKKRVKAHVIRPTPTALPRAKENKTWLFNPSVTAPYDVRDNLGQLLVKQGTIVNPLDRVRLSSTLLLFDGDDKAQVDWVIDELKKPGKVKLILTSGSIKETTERFKQAIYFDLNGFLVRKFHITALPARIFQAGSNLQITEVTL